MSKRNQDEIDLFYFIEKFNNFVHKSVVLLFDALRFAIKYWVLILVLAIIGVGLGYYVQTENPPEKKARVLVRINFDSVNSVYSVVEDINTQISEEDYKKIEDQAIRKELRKIFSIEITPIINVRDILDRYDINDRKLEGFLKSIEYEFEDDDEFTQLSETFRTEYKYHYFDITAANDANQSTLNALMDYLNSNPILQQVKETGKAALKERIESNQFTIEQINNVMDAYTTKETSPAPQAQLYVVDKNFNISEVFRTKVTLQAELEILKRELVYADRVILNVNKPKLVKDKSIIKNEMVIYPIILIAFLFLWGALRAIYFSLKAYADSKK